MGVCWLVIYGQYPSLTSTADGGSGMRAFQGLYYVTTFFNQFGPNCTTWLVAGVSSHGTLHYLCTASHDPIPHDVPQ